MILDIYKDSFEFASRKISILLILGVLSFFNILVIPLIFFCGYNYRVVKLSTESMINGEDVPPEFNDFKQMFMDGLKLIVVLLCYLIVPFILIAISISGNSVNVALFLIGIILLFVARLFSYLAIPHMAVNGDSFKSAFALSEINSIMASIGYLRYIIFYVGLLLISCSIFVVVFLILSFILAILGITVGGVYISLIGTILINLVLLFIVSPYLSLFQNRCAGLVYNLGS